jgi:probable F420-dependent oxidoreductase
MQIGLVLPMADGDGPSVREWPWIRSIARQAEAEGLDSLWVYDHLVTGAPGEPPGGIHEAWTVLSAIAAVTERVTLGTIVLGTGFRPPALTAKMAATLDEVANGRLILGLGTGWHEPEYRAFGYPYDHRAGRFDEALQVIVPLVRGETVTFKGTWHEVDACVLVPPPPRPARLPGRMPILIASKGERVQRLAARWADAWNAAWFGLPEPSYHERLAGLHRACEAEGRDPSTIEVTVGVGVRAPGVRGFGTALEPDAPTIARAFDAWRDLGVGHIQVALDPVTEANVSLLAEARRLHLGGR